MASQRSSIMNSYWDRIVAVSSVVDLVKALRRSYVLTITIKQVKSEDFFVITAIPRSSEDIQKQFFLRKLRSISTNELAFLSQFFRKEEEKERNVKHDNSLSNS
jgi:hypothetical protein